MMPCAPHLLICDLSRSLCGVRSLTCATIVQPSFLIVHDESFLSARSPSIFTSLPCMDARSSALPDCMALASSCELDSDCRAMVAAAAGDCPACRCHAERC